MDEETMTITRELWALLVRALDGDAAARVRAQHELIASAPYWWDEDLDARPLVAKATLIPLPRRAGR